MNFTKSEKIYLQAEFYNWDFGLELPKSLLRDENCDKATALLIYWESDPDFYYGHESLNDIPDWALEGYELMKEAEELIIKNQFLEEIAYTPDLYRIPKDSKILAKIPEKLLIPSIGKNNKILCNQYFYGKQLLEACKNGDLEAVSELLDKKYDIVNVCIDGDTPLHNAVEKIKVFEYLLSKGANYNNAGDEVGIYPIHSASFMGKNSSIKALLKYGADINSISPHKKKTPLHFVLDITSDYHWKRYKLINTIKLLLKNGASIEMKDINGQTPLDLAINNGNKDALQIIKDFH